MGENRNRKFRLTSLVVTLPLYMIGFCAILCAMNTYLGYSEFKNIFEDQYGVMTSQVAYTAASFIDGDDIDRYVKNPVADEEWKAVDEKLNMLTVEFSLAYIYVTVNDSDYTWRMYLYDTVNPLVQNSSVIELGHTSSLINKSEEYIENIRRVMERGERYTTYSYNKETGGHVTTSVPVLNSSGKPVALVGVVKPMSEVTTIQKQYLRSSLVAFLLFATVCLFVYVLFLRNKILNPLRSITEETSLFAQHKGQLSGVLKEITDRNELGTLARSVEKMSVDMNTYIDELTKSTAEKERLGAELDVATQIQANMLPRIFPPYENHPEIELYASMSPAKEVGGDFYDFFMVDDDHFAVVVGDVSGKGVPAALFMVIAKTIIKNETLQGYSPSKVFELVNGQLCEGNDAGLFVTCWMGLLTISTGELVFANAGHTPPILCQNGDVSYLVTKPNLMLAGMDGMKYSEHSIKLGKGDRLFAYTDGVTEATNEREELYGEDRLLEAMKKTIGKTPQDALKIIKADVDAFVNAESQFDDITMLELGIK